MQHLVFRNWNTGINLFCLQDISMPLTVAVYVCTVMPWNTPTEMKMGHTC